MPAEMNVPQSHHSSASNANKQQVLMVVDAWWLTEGLEGVPAHHYKRLQEFESVEMAMKYHKPRFKHAFVYADANSIVRQESLYVERLSFYPKD